MRLLPHVPTYRLLRYVWEVGFSGFLLKAHPFLDELLCFYYDALSFSESC